MHKAHRVPAECGGKFHISQAVLDIMGRVVIDEIRSQNVYVFKNTVFPAESGCPHETDGAGDDQGHVVILRIFQDHLVGALHPQERADGSFVRAVAFNELKGRIVTPEIQIVAAADHMVEK